MLSALLRRRRRLVAALVVAAVALSAASVLAFGGCDDVVVYNGRSQYGDEQAFRDFEARDGDVARAARRHGAGAVRAAASPRATTTPADLLVTTDLANLWRAKEAGLLAPVALGDAGAPGARRVPRPATATGGGCRCASARRCAPPSASRPSAIDGYEDLGDAALQGPALPAHVEQRVQPVARRRHARQARRGGHGADAAVLDGERPADPRLGRRRAGGDRARAAATSASPTTTTSARILEDDPDFPVAPAWPDQDGAGAHTNLSGVGLVRGSEHRADAVALMEPLTAPRGAGADRRERRARRERRRAAGRAHPRLGDGQARPDRRRRAPAACCPRRSR